MPTGIHPWCLSRQGCIVAYWCPDAGEVRFRRYFTHLFDLPLAVISFNQWSRFLQAIIPNLAIVLSSFYFDDATFQDLASAANSAQTSVRGIASSLGSPFSDGKSQDVASAGDFLGLFHDLSSVRTQGTMSFWIRPRLAEKIRGIIQEATFSRQLASGVASKLYGCVGFLGHAAFGRVARSGLQALQLRQQDHGSASLTREIEAAFRTILAVLSFQPKHISHLFPAKLSRTLVASYASQERPREGGAGVLLVSPAGRRLGCVINVSDEVFRLWDEQTVKIAQLELLAVVQGVVTFAAELRGNTTVWFVDNIASLMALIKRRSASVELDAMAGIVHHMLYGLHACVYFEWVQSKSNWADGVSRDGMGDGWARDHGFLLSYVQCQFLL